MVRIVSAGMLGMSIESDNLADGIPFEDARKEEERREAKGDDSPKSRKKKYVHVPAPCVPLKGGVKIKVKTK